MCQPRVKKVELFINTYCHHSYYKYPFFHDFRVYKGLTNIVKEEKARKVTLGGRKHGQLKKKTIQRLAGYYKQAIYDNKGDVEVSKKEIVHDKQVHSFLNRKFFLCRQ